MFKKIFPVFAVVCCIGVGLLFWDGEDLSSFSAIVFDPCNQCSAEESCIDQQCVLPSPDLTLPGETDCSQNPEWVTESGKAIVCHKVDFNRKVWKTIEISFRALPVHIAHGDACGDCSLYYTENPETPSPTEDEIVICHKRWRTITVSPSSLEAHIKHGDTLGACK